MNKAWTTHTLHHAADAPGITPGTTQENSGLTTDQLTDREWLLTNGTGAYAMGTALGANTRRYHGLLVAATRPPVGRVLALNQVFDQLVLHDQDGQGETTQSVELGSCLFEGDGGKLVHAPQGHRVLARFDRGLNVRWTYVWGKLGVERALILHPKAQAATLRYRVAGLETLAGKAALHVAPMLTLRDFHALQPPHLGPQDFGVTVPRGGKRLTVTHHDTAVTFAAPDGKFQPAPDVWHGVAYPRDTHRGQGDREPYFVPGNFIIPLSIGPKVAEATLTVALGSKTVAPVLKPGRAPHLKKTLDHLPGDDRQQKALALAADDFVVERPVDKKKTLTTLIAGYPWFADWGRDTFIALPGLLLATGRLNAARDTLQAFARSIQHGLVPNRFDDYTNQPHYNTVDASMWFVHAGLAYADHAGQLPAWLRKAAIQVLDAHVQGTHALGHDGRELPIAMDTDGLLTAGDDHSQLTWMDAACHGHVFTPRPGKCVEINALWHSNLLGLAAWLAEDDKHQAHADRYAELAAKAKRSFNAAFWSDEHQHLIDHVTPAGHADPALRPNQVIACALERSPLPLTKRKAVLAAVESSLLTPMGLRTLPPDDPNYHPHYAGPQFDRDRAYHQGTVWPWLIGPYAEAVLRVGKHSKKAKARAAAALQPLLDRLLDEGLGQLAEIHDASEPFAARGCPAQAWSVAELVRVLALIEEDQPA
ncbi:MAG: amylo-alpha-1,6-glucosidase [Planctomycetota bacterium]